MNKTERYSSSCCRLVTATCGLLWNCGLVVGLLWICDGLIGPPRLNRASTLARYPGQDLLKVYSKSVRLRFGVAGDPLWKMAAPQKTLPQADLRGVIMKRTWCGVASGTLGRLPNVRVSGTGIQKACRGLIGAETEIWEAVVSA